MTHQSFYSCIQRCLAESRIQWAVLFVITFAGTCFPTTSSCAQATQTGSSSKQDRTEAIAAIPFAELNARARQKIQAVATNPSFYRRLPVSTIDADPDHFRFLIRKPEVVVNIWRLMGVTQMTVERTGPYTVATNDGAGTMSNLELIYGNNDLHVFYGTGSYEGPVLRRKLNGRCVIVVRTQSSPKTGGGFDLTSQLDVFLKVDNAAASLITRTIQPIVGSTADHNFVESLKFIQRLNDTTRSNGPGVTGMAQRLTIDQETRDAYVEVVEKVYERAFQSAGTGLSQVAAKTNEQVELYRPSSRTYNYFGNANDSQSAATNQTDKKVAANAVQKVSTRVNRTSPRLANPGASGRETVRGQSSTLARPSAAAVRLSDQPQSSAQPLYAAPNSQQASVAAPKPPARDGGLGPTEGHSVLVGGPLSPPPAVTRSADRRNSRAATVRLSDAPASVIAPASSRLSSKRR